MSWLKSKKVAENDRSPPSSGKPVVTKRPGPPNMPPSRVRLTFLFILAVNYLLMKVFFTDPDAPVTLPYTVFKEEVAKKNVQAVYGRGEAIEGRFVKPIRWPSPNDKTAEKAGVQPRPASTFTTTLPFFLGPGLEELLIEKGVEIRAEPIQPTEGTRRRFELHDRLAFACLDLRFRVRPVHARSRSLHRSA